MAEILIKKVMDEKGIKVDRMLPMLSISRSSAYRILQGIKVPDINELEEFAEVLKVPIEELYHSKFSKVHKMSQI